MLPSYHHSYTKARLIGALLKIESFTVFSELTLQIDNQTYKPDICVYPEHEVNLSLPDSLEVKEMPILAIEILSQNHTIQEILERFAIYFAAIVKSCWLIVPIAGAVIVYTSPEKAQLFNTGTVIDDQLNIKLPLNEVFVN
ncbi:MAG: Uma2 family endonuclease [Thiomargarita sp.]|nr:Uma2 family endonuclease [Thiomargarita sp.]